jgi:hypothetical protein
MNLRFLKSQGYDGEIVRAGSVRSDISEFWAQRFIEQGIAVVEETPKKTEAAKPETVETPKKKTAKRKK